MGGGGYARPTYSAPANARGSTAFSTAAQQALTQQSLHEELDPRGKVLECVHGSTPIVVAVDVTGSMGNWTKIIWDKLPMFYGQLCMQGYCPNPSMSFAAVGDALTDTAPLQVGKFAQGLEIDEIVNKVWLEGRGGANNKESYELVACYYASEKVSVAGAATKPFFFITGDEGIHDDMHSPKVLSWLEPALANQPTTTAEAFRRLREKFHVFHVKKPYHNTGLEPAITEQWASCVGNENILLLADPKSCVDVMLGAVAIVTGKRTLDEYIEDLKERGQDEQRRSEVRHALAGVTRWEGASVIETAEPQPHVSSAGSDASTAPTEVEHKASECRVDDEGKRWRMCAGAAVFNSRGELLVGERMKIPGAWNAPQGGVDIGEQVADAAAREAFEECGLVVGKHIALVDVLDTPTRYEAGGWLKKAGFAGQELHWVVYRTIDVAGDADPSAITNLMGHDGEPPEFSQVRWTPIDQVIEEMWTAKRAPYESLRDGVRSLFAQDR